MANIFTRRMSANVGTSNVTVGNYTVPAGNTTTLIGLSFCNTTTGQIKGSAFIQNATYQTYIIKDAPVPAGSSLVVVGGEQKIVMLPGDRVEVQSDTATSLDCIMSLLEIN